jgi:prepilin-type processing-associated H-X9-DG protein
MEENLVGYLLNALDDEPQRQVEASLRESPELRAHLERLERALAPLAADRETPEPPPGLALSALARIAEYQCRKLPDAPAAPRSQSLPANRSWLRRPDVLVAALLLIVLGGIGSSSLIHLWRDYHGRTQCRNNLFLIWGGLRRYCEVHNGNFPLVEEKGAHGVAGIFMPILGDSGVLGSEVSIACPAQERRPPQSLSVREMEDLYASNPNQFLQEARSLAGGYAYSLGYRDTDGYHGLRCDTVETDRLKLLPIVADRLESLMQLNSANHGGTGQNVLYLDGHVEWRTNRHAGINGDDIFVNRHDQLLAGEDREDTVLGPGDASPTPRE